MNIDTCLLFAIGVINIILLFLTIMTYKTLNKECNDEYEILGNKNAIRVEAKCQKKSVNFKSNPIIIDEIVSMVMKDAEGNVIGKYNE